MNLSGPQTLSALVNPPRTLHRRLESACHGLVDRPGAVAYPHYWQVPAATEKAGWEAVARSAAPLPFDYVAFPWATIIDGLRANGRNTWPILMALADAQEIMRGWGARPRVTVAQHIHALQFVELFEACGITDLFWSHATHGRPLVGRIRIHAFPLFPAQTPDARASAPSERPRRYLANFIGAYNPRIYLTNVRQVIFDDPNAHGDLLIVKREAWHFDRAVYQEQVKGLSPDQQRLRAEEQMTQEYLEAIRDSWFTLCPSGSGPNSIRIFESLCLGSIPIILTRELRLVGAHELWERAAIIEDDSEAGYRRAVQRARAMSEVDRRVMLAAGQQLAALTSPASYADILRAAFSQDRNTSRPRVQETVT